MKKIKKSNSIVFKMFSIAFISIMSLITIIFLVQSLYINKFYMSRKIDNLIKNINSFSEQYKEENWTYDELARQINKFSSTNNASLTVNGLGQYDIEFINETEMYEEYLLTILVEDKNYYDIYISEEELIRAFDGKIPLRYESFKIEAVIYDQEILTPVKINNYEMLEKEELMEEDINNYYRGKVKLIDLSNVMENIIYEPITENMEMMDDSYMDYINNADLLLDYQQKNNVHYIITDMPFVNIKEVNFIKILDMKDGKSEFIDVKASLQPVGEVISILSEYYIVFYLLAIVISLFIAWIYSRLISSPLLKLTYVADKMAQMNFTEKSTIKRDDELGILSNSLNILSANLDEALTHLKEANKQLVIDMEKEKKQEQVRKEFVANVSHELKTPLGIIKGFAEGIKDGIKKEKSDYYIDVILDEIEKMNTLIFEMLELSKLEAGKAQQKEGFDIKKLINKAVDVLEIPIQNKDIKIHINGDFGKVYGVKFQIDQVIMNLLSNAVKYCTDCTDIKVTGEIKEGYNYMSIYNEGNQLTKEELESIWLRFYKIDKSHHRESGGTGLGLAIVKSILDGHDSDYGVMNKDDGVVFYFSVKLAD